MRAVSIRITGLVQGVGFRYYCKRNADKMGISGWAKNLPDGSVEVQAEGDPKTLEDFIERLVIGPSGSRVTDLHSEEAPVQRRQGFETR